MSDPNCPDCKGTGRYEDPSHGCSRHCNCAEPYNNYDRHGTVTGRFTRPAETPGGIDNAAEPLYARIAELEAKVYEQDDDARIALRKHVDLENFLRAQATKIAALRARLAAAEAERDALRAALKKYGNHLGWVNVTAVDCEREPCICGYDAALRGEATT